MRELNVKRNSASSASWWKLSGVQRALMIYVVIPMLAIVGIGLGVGIERLNSLETERLKDDLELLGRAIRLPVQEAILENDEEAVQRALESVFEIGRVYGASVYDANGNRVAAAGIASRDLSRSRVAQEVVLTGEQQERTRQISGVEMYSQFLPLFDPLGQPNGFIQINRQASDFDASFARLTRAAWVIWLAMALLTLTVVIYGHYRGVGRHVNQLKQAMTRVEAGQRDYRTATDGPGEVAEIARGLNQMLDSIERKDEELEQARLQEQELAEKLQHQEKMAAIGNVASGIAHELGAPLTVIDGRAQRLLRKESDPDRQRQLNAIRGQVARLTRIVQQLLNYCRPAEEHLEEVTDDAALNLPELLQGVLDSIRHELDDEALRLRLILPDQPLPTFYASASRLELALVNLVRNAAQVADQWVVVQVDYESGPVSLHSRQQPEVTIRVLDDGPGLSEALSEQELMEPFVTTKGQGEGTGLGLAIVTNVAQVYRGHLRLENNSEGRGCIATLTLKLAT